MKAEVVTICGSMRFYNQMLALANELTLGGKIVLMPFVLKIDDPGLDEWLQDLHRQKILLSSTVYVVGERIGQSTSEEIIFAQRRGIKVVHAS
jgi:hypothetical protein